MNDNSPLHILIVTYNDYPSYDGLSTRVANLARGYAEEGHRVTIFAPNVDGRQKGEERVGESTRIVRVNIPLVGLLKARRLWLRGYVTIIQTLFALALYGRYLRKTKLDIIQAQQIYAIPTALILKVLTRAKVVADDITTVADILRETGHAFLAYLFTALEQVLFAGCDEFIATSEVCRDYCVARGAVPGIWGPNGVDCRKFTPLPVNNEKKEIFFNCSTYFHQNIKAIGFFLELGRALIGRVDRPFVCHLVCGPLANLPRELMAQQAELGEWLVVEPSALHIEPLIQGADIALLPYRPGDHLTGGARLKVLEYMACGKVVVSTPEGVEGIPGLVAGRHLLVPENEEALVATLAEILVNPAEYAPLGEAARDFVVTRYDWRLISRRIVAAYAGLTKKKFRSR